MISILATATRTRDAHTGVPFPLVAEHLHIHVIFTQEITEQFRFRLLQFSQDGVIFGMVSAVKIWIDTQMSYRKFFIRTQLELPVKRLYIPFKRLRFKHGVVLHVTRVTGIVKHHPVWIEDFVKNVVTQGLCEVLELSFWIVLLLDLEETGDDPLQRMPDNHVLPVVAVVPYDVLNVQIDILLTSVTE